MDKVELKPLKVEELKELTKDSEISPYMPEKAEHSEQVKLLVKSSVATRFTKENAAIMTAKGQKVRALNASLRSEFKRNARAFSKVMKDLPDLKSEDVIKMCVHLALKDEDYESASKFAEKLLEYERPKLARIESKVTHDTSELTDEQLQEIAIKEGLFTTAAEAGLIKPITH
jgi:hypothetical protein